MSSKSVPPRSMMVLPKEAEEGMAGFVNHEIDGIREEEIGSVD